MVGVLLAACALQAAVTGVHRIERAPARRIEAVLRQEVSAPRLQAGQWILFAPRPPDLPSQLVASAEMEPRGAASSELGPLRQQILAARVAAAAGPTLQGMTITGRYRVTLLSRRLVEGDAVPVLPLAPDARRLALAASGLLDFDSPAFQSWLDEHRLGRPASERDVDYARRVFSHIKRSYGYEYDSRMERRASFVCRSRGSDCGGLCGLFVSAMRKHGIPARLLVGRWAQSAKPGERLGDIEYAQQHVKAEFFAEGVGWVPVDPSSGVLHDRSAAGLRFFGDDPGDFLVFHLDHDLRFDSVYFGQHAIRWFQSPVYWVTGGGTLDGARLREGWTVTPLP